MIGLLTGFTLAIVLLSVRTDNVALWAAYFLLAFAPLIILSSSDPQSSPRWRYAIAGLVELFVIGLFVLKAFLRL